MTTQRTVAQEIAPKMAELSANVLFGDVWERPELSKRDRSLITVAALVALYRTDQLRGHINRALDNGVTKEEIGEVITHMALALSSRSPRQPHDDGTVKQDCR